MNLIYGLKRIIHLPHREVGPCPKCGSDQTGLYFKSSSKFSNSIVMHSYMKYSGELVLPKMDISDGLNCFCMNCNVSWDGRYRTSWVNLIELNEIKATKGISERAEKKFKTYDKDYKTTERLRKKEEKKLKRKEKRTKTRNKKKGKYTL